MSIYLTSTTLLITSTGYQILNSLADYVLNDLEISISAINATGAGTCAAILALTTEGVIGHVPFETIVFEYLAAAGGVVNFGAIPPVSQRSFPSGMGLNANSAIGLNVTTLTNLTNLRVVINLSGLQLN